MHTLTRSPNSLSVSSGTLKANNGVDYPSRVPEAPHPCRLCGTHGSILSPVFRSRAGRTACSVFRTPQPVLHSPLEGTGDSRSTTFWSSKQRLDKVQHRIISGLEIVHRRRHLVVGHHASPGHRRGELILGVQ